MKTPSILCGLIVTCGVLAQAPVVAPAPASAQADYIAHEWGTFTSVQGDDGTQLVWNPFESSELPKFVYHMQNPLGKTVLANGAAAPARLNPQAFVKAAILARQRMETPVIYFYAKQPQTVNVDVKFPAGLITEWYPQIVNPTNQATIMPGLMTQWKDVEILPGDGSAEAAKFPKEEGGSHYYAARETRASALRLKTAAGAEQYEKFLFYRGIAQFQAPLSVAFYGDRIDSVSLTNTSPQALGPLFIYSVRGDRAMMIPVEDLDAAKMLPVELKFDANAKPVAEVQEELRTALRQSLVKAGLYAEEAAAMVKTWDDSWLGEQGTRVLYLLPQSWTDEILPLKLSPAPKEVKRVFVGRAELISPEQDWVIMKEIVRYATGGEAEKKAAVEAVSKIQLGRFVTAALGKAQAAGPRTAEFYRAVAGLQSALAPKLPAEPAPPVPVVLPTPAIPAATASWSAPAPR